MYRCTDCERKFFDPEIRQEKHSLDCPPYERILCCPFCGSAEIKPVKVRHCKCCGARMYTSDGDYCSPSCKRRGEKLWELQRKRAEILKNDPVTKITRLMNEYNLKHGTDMSYGQFVATVLPGLGGVKHGY